MMHCLLMVKIQVLLTDMPVRFDRFSAENKFYKYNHLVFYLYCDHIYKYECGTFIFPSYLKRKNVLDPKILLS